MAKNLSRSRSIRAAKAQSAEQPALDSAADPSPNPEPEKEKETAGRLVIPLDAEGRLDLSSYRPGSRERLKRALMDGALLGELGINPEPIDEFTPKNCKGLYSLLNEFCVWAASTPFFGVPPELARQALAYSDEDMEILAEPTCAVLNKRASNFLLKHKDEALLLSALISVHQRKVMYLAALMKKRAAQKPETPPPADPPAGGLRVL